MNCPKCGTLTVKLGVVQCATGDAEKRGCPRCRGIWFQQLAGQDARRHTSLDGIGAGAEAPRGASGEAPDAARGARALPAGEFWPRVAAGGFTKIKHKNKEYVQIHHPTGIRGHCHGV